MTESGQTHNLEEVYNEWKRIEKIRFQLLMDDPMNKKKYDDWVESQQEAEAAFRNLLAKVHLKTLAPFS
jgi:hypothetical protein